MGQPNIKQGLFGLLAVFAFAIFYAGINYWIWRNAGFHSFFLMQAIGCLAVIWTSGRWGWRLFFHLILISAAFNIGYGLVMDEAFTRTTFFWVAAEIRQSSSAAGQFSVDFLLTSLVVIGMALWLMLVRHFCCRALEHRDAVPWNLRGSAWILFLMPSMVVRFLPLGPLGAERNLYEYFADWMLAAPAPERAAVDLPLRQDGADKPLHILWIIDESVAAEEFQPLFGAPLRAMGAVDFGVTRALANCSAPSHVALRSGVDVREASPSLDLRRTPSIWGYAKAAGYRTFMIDGQHDGAPQNFLYAPERALIDEYSSLLNGPETDGQIAKRLNQQLKSAEPSFGYALLRGVHFPYAANLPATQRLSDNSPRAQYRAGLAYSKNGFFETLLDGVDRQRVAIIYTADHGQNLARPTLPHCSTHPVAKEYEVPLILFLPDALQARYRRAEPQGQGHVASQLLPTSLIWMGYDRAAAEQRYDFDLSQASARPLRFGRAVIPVAPDAAVDVQPALPLAQ